MVTSAFLNVEVLAADAAQLARSAADLVPGEPNIVRPTRVVLFGLLSPPRLLELQGDS